MLKRQISYTDYNDQDVTDTFYFSLSSSEVKKLELGSRDGMVRTLIALAHSNDNAAIYDFIESLVLNSYGEKSADGKDFLKLTDDGLTKLSIRFSQSAAFEALMDELLENDKAASAFLEGIFPKKYQEAMNDPENIKNAEKFVEELKRGLDVKDRVDEIKSARVLPDIAGEAEKQKAKKAEK